MDKDTIEKWILPHLSTGKRGFKSHIPTCQIVRAIFYRLKTGCQWRELPVKQFTDEVEMSWQSVYYYFNKWSRDNSWQQVWIELVRANRRSLDLSCMQLDGSHTAAKRGGEAIGYQGRKAAKTTNSLFLADNSGQMLAVSYPRAGQHHDLYQIETMFKELLALLKSAGVDTRGVFLNADSGFDSRELRQICSTEEIEANIKANPRNTINDSRQYHYFDEELYKRRMVIEQANAWLDGFKSLLIRFETSARNWISLHWMAFSIGFLRKFNTCIKV